MRRLWNRCGCHRESVCLLASGTLPEAEQVEAQRHLADCASCRRYFEEIKSVSAPLVDWERNFSQIKPGQAVRTRWAEAIEAASEPQVAASRPWGLSFVVLWRELIWPCRRALTGMAALWLVMLWVNLGFSEHRTTGRAARSAPTSETWLALAEQRRLLAELIPPATLPPAEPPRRNTPKPRSERRSSWETASASRIGSPATEEAVHPRDSVLECASPLALLEHCPAIESARGLAQAKTSRPSELFREI